MKQVNKDYISVVRSSNGRLQYEKMPIIKSEKLKNKLVALAEDEGVTIERMLECLKASPGFKFLALPYYELHGDVDFCEPDDWAIFQLAKELRKAKTKIKFLEKALRLIEECDYRWNVIRITSSYPDIIIRSHGAYEDTYVRIRLSNEVSIVFESSELGCDIDGTLCYTVYKNNATVRPYRSVVQLYDCSDEILHVTKMFDPEEGQWDNALRSLVTTANVILQDSKEYFRRKVVEDGQMMLEKIKFMCLDPESYISWLEDLQDKISVDYSECSKSVNHLDFVDESNRRLYLLQVIGQKMAQAIILSENLTGWVNEGPEFSDMGKVYTDLASMAKVLLKQMEEVHDALPAEVFEYGYGEYDLVQYERHDAALKLRECCERIRMLLQMEQRFEQEDAELEYDVE